MNRQEAEQLAERIRSEAPKLLTVVGIEHLGPASEPIYATDFAVKCACQISGLQFVVHSLQHWEDLKQHVIVRLCKWVSRLFKRGGNTLGAESGV
jgi:hypothetical protein